MAGLGLLIIAGLLDWLTGPELASSLFYLLPIAWVTWKGGRWWGLAAALSSGAVWLCLALVSHPRYANEMVPYWNALVRTSMFCLVTGLGSELLERKRAEMRLRDANESLRKQTHILQSILSSMGDGVLVGDSMGNLLHLNPAAARLLRLAQSETNISSWLQSQERFAESASGTAPREHPLRRAMRGEPLDEVELFLPKTESTGGTWLSATARPLPAPEGKIVGGVIVLTDVTVRKEVERQIAEASDREQRKLGEDLHDGLCQQLVSAAFAARKVAGRLAERSLPEAEEVTELAELIGDSIAQARDVARGLYLVPPEVGGLASALDELALQTRSRHPCACNFVGKHDIPLLEDAVATNLFRISQEAVNNALKHSHASEITLRLDSSAEHISLTVENDGLGFQPASESARGLGLRMMNYRARLIGAALEIGPRTAGGTVVRCAIRNGNPSENSVRKHVAA
jgi:two-component system, LuxR family, sensor kinase FixL